MAILRKSLSQDTVDHISHTWAFLFVLLLSVIILFVPLSPSMTLTPLHLQPIQQQTDNSKVDTTSTTPVMNTLYKASCWTPSQFTGSMVDYSISICSGALNAYAQGKNFSAASLYTLQDSAIPIANSNKNDNTISAENFRKPDPSAEGSGQDKDSKSTNDKESQEKHAYDSFQQKRSKLHSGIYDFISFKAPLYLFLFAICLRLPFAVWSLLSSYCGLVNVDQTLVAAQNTLSTNSTMQNTLRENLGQSGKKSTALTYLMMKLLMTVVLCILVVLVHQSLLAETEKLENDLDIVNMMNDEVNTMNGGINSPSTTTMPSENKDKSIESTFDPTNQNIHCDFAIRQLQAIQHYTISCIFTADIKSTNAMVRNVQSNGDNGLQQSKTPLMAVSEKRIILLYKSLFTMVLALLVVLTIFNVISLVGWFLKLVLASCRSTMGLRSDSSMDIVFIVAMAWSNTGAVVAMEVAKCSGKYGSSDTDGMEGESTKMT